MRTGTWWIIIIVLIIVIAGLAWVLFSAPAPLTNVNATSTAATTATTTAATTTAMATSTMPTISSPTSGATVSKTFVVTGEAPGTWFFEAVFPVNVLDKSGKVVGHGQARAEGDWMTTAMVPFSATTTVTGYTGTATLVLKKDNPSGNPQNDASTTIPIVIK